MLDLEPVLGSVVCGLSDENYEQSLARYHLWFELGQAYSQIPPDLVFDTIWNYKNKLPSSVSCFIYQTCPSILRFANDAESNNILAPHSSGLRDRLCTSLLQEFFDTDVKVTYTSYSITRAYYVDLNLIAHCANLGYIEESAIRYHILQSLISHPNLSDHQANALIILFKIAGATFAECVDPLVIDRCFDRLKGYSCYSSVQRGLLDVSEPFKGVQL